MPAMKGHHLDDASSPGLGRGFEAAARKRRLPVLLRLAGTAAFGCLILFLGGFALFATHIGQMTTPENPPAADAIIVLTGGQARRDAALELLKSGKALFSCCVDIDHAALDTIGNAEESAKWVRTHDYNRVLLVTNNYHMPRSLLEVGRLLDGEELDPYPVVNSKLDNGGWIVQPDALRVLFTEYNKYLAALARGALPHQVADSAAIANASAAAQD